MKIENIKVVWEVEAALKSNDVFSVTCESGDELDLCRNSAVLFIAGLIRNDTRCLDEAIADAFGFGLQRAA